MQWLKPAVNNFWVLSMKSNSTRSLKSKAMSRMWWPGTFADSLLVLCSANILVTTHCLSQHEVVRATQSGCRGSPAPPGRHIRMCSCKKSCCVSQHRHSRANCQKHTHHREGISLESRTDLHIIANGTSTVDSYQEELFRTIIWPYAGAVGPSFFLVQDNAQPP